MSGKSYIGINNIAKENKKIYVGVNNVAREVKKAYVGVNGIAKEIYSGDEPWGTRTYIPGDIIVSNGFSPIGPYTGSNNYTKLATSSAYSGQLWDSANGPQYKDSSGFRGEKILQTPFYMYKNWSISGFFDFSYQARRGKEYIDRENPNFGRVRPYYERGFSEGLKIGNISIWAYYIKDDSNTLPRFEITIKDINGQVYTPFDITINKTSWYAVTDYSNVHNGGTFNITCNNNIINTSMIIDSKTYTGTATTLNNKIYVDSISSHVNLPLAEYYAGIYQYGSWYGQLCEDYHDFPYQQKSGIKKITEIIY